MTVREWVGLAAAAMLIASCTTPSGRHVAEASHLPGGTLTAEGARFQLLGPASVQSVTRPFRVRIRIDAPPEHPVSEFLSFRMSGFVLDPTVQEPDGRGGWSRPTNGRGEGIGRITVAAGRSWRMVLRVATGSKPHIRHLGDDERGMLPVRSRTVTLTASFGQLTAHAYVTVAGVTIASGQPHQRCLRELIRHACNVDLVLVNHSDRAVPTGVYVDAGPGRWSVRTDRLGWVTPHADADLFGLHAARLGRLPPAARVHIIVRIPGDESGRHALVVVPLSNASTTEYYRTCISGGFGGHDLQAAPACW
jgi:hypothetical protein